VKKLIITGSAPCTVEDIERVPGYRDFDFMAIGLDAVDKYPWPILYVVTYHPEKLPEALERRAAIGNTDYQTISHISELAEKGTVTKYDVDIIEPHEGSSGSSAMLGTLAGLRLGYKRIILCGCPLQGKNLIGGSYEGFQAGWEAKKKVVAEFVRSMSGWTREFLGAPTDDWLREAS
jgi:hypothetical protein